MSIAFDRFIEAKRGNTITCCQVAIQHHTSAADRANHSINLLDRNGRFGFLRHWRERLFGNSLGEKLVPRCSPRQMEPQGCERHRWVTPRGRKERERVS